MSALRRLVRRSCGRLTSLAAPRGRSTPAPAVDGREHASRLIGFRLWWSPLNEAPPTSEPAILAPARAGGLVSGWLRTLRRATPGGRVGRAGLATGRAASGRSQDG